MDWMLSGSLGEPPLSLHSHKPGPPLQTHCLLLGSPKAALKFYWNSSNFIQSFSCMLVKTSAYCWRNKTGVPTVLLRPQDVVESSLDITNKPVRKGQVISVAAEVRPPSSCCWLLQFSPLGTKSYQGVAKLSKCCIMHLCGALQCDEPK